MDRPRERSTCSFAGPYYDDLRVQGNPFDHDRALKYQPLGAGEFHETLYDFKTKDKTSPPMQLADLALWPMCIGGYDPTNRALVSLEQRRTLIDSRLNAADRPSQGIKYSCWELQDAEKTKTRS